MPKVGMNPDRQIGASPGRQFVAAVAFRRAANEGVVELLPLPTVKIGVAPRRAAIVKPLGKVPPDASP